MSCDCWRDLPIGIIKWFHLSRWDNFDESEQVGVVKIGGVHESEKNLSDYLGGMVPFEAVLRQRETPVRTTGMNGTFAADHAAAEPYAYRPFRLAA
ncbi:hypothetical protein D3877_08475 [Azospirillum cavernae]|uniref:Uncharacterized protein n=1 Tax=Azospirillum cavernae TaxID=2320860 RepID=A0A418W3H0_9PROT|nr:hypothetical protein D3877_08475 [Azospirillum cavernae]